MNHAIRNLSGYNTILGTAEGTFLRPLEKTLENVYIGGYPERGLTIHMNAGKETQDNVFYEISDKQAIQAIRDACMVALGEDR